MEEAAQVPGNTPHRHGSNSTDYRLSLHWEGYFTALYLNLPWTSLKCAASIKLLPHSPHWGVRVGCHTTSLGLAPVRLPMSLGKPACVQHKLQPCRKSEEADQPLNNVFSSWKLCIGQGILNLCIPTEPAVSIPQLCARGSTSLIP